MSRAIVQHVRRISFVLACVGVFTGCGTSLHDAARWGDAALVTEILNVDAATKSRLVNARDRNGNTPLHEAAANGKVDTLRLLIEAGADLNARDNTGMTPLHAAAMWDRRETIEALIDAGADMEALDDFGDTPFLTAAVFGRVNALEALKARGANIHAKSKNGQGALASAREWRKDAAVSKLQEFGVTE